MENKLFLRVRCFATRGWASRINSSSRFSFNVFLLSQKVLYQPVYKKVILEFKRYIEEAARVMPGCFSYWNLFPWVFYIVDRSWELVTWYDAYPPRRSSVSRSDETARKKKTKKRRKKAYRMKRIGDAGREPMGNEKKEKKAENKSWVGPRRFSRRE